MGREPGLPPGPAGATLAMSRGGILWQRWGSVGLRVLIVRIYLNTGRSVFAVILFHAMNNVSTYLFPNYGSHYDPFVACLIVTGTPNL